MASTLALPGHASEHTLSFGSLVPPPSQDLAMHQVPDVFVIPPEEEQEDNPPWCYFDAAKQAFCTSPDVDALDVALGICQQTDNRAPAFSRHFSNESQDTIVMPRLARLRDMDLDGEDGQTDIRSRSRSTGSVRSRAFDAEIVEVVKVRRNEGVADVGEGRTLKMKKSSTFRARATQALRSIKNVGRGSAARRATVSEPKPLAPSNAATTLPSRHSCQDPGSPRPTSPTINRRRSLTLSQMFAFKENQGSRPVPSPVDEPISSSTTPSFESAAGFTRPMSPTQAPGVSGSHSKRLQPSPSLEDCMATPTRSPSLGGDDPSKPTLSKRKSFRRRLSVLELQKLFSIGGGSSNSQQPDADVEEDLFSPVHSRPLSMDSGAILSTSSSRKSSVSSGEMSSRPSSSSRTSAASSAGKGGEDEDLEMRLDSLHFDSLHFDPDEIMSSV